MSQDEQELEKVVAINDAPTALTANMAAAAKLANRLRAAGADLPQEVWRAIEDGRTQDFQSHPDFMAATHLASMFPCHAADGGVLTKCVN